MKHVGEIILGLMVMALAVVCVWEFTIISSLKKEVKAKQLMIDAQAVRARDLQEQIVERDQTIKYLTLPQKAVVPMK